MRYYYKARIYSPTLGRFLQTDPIGYEGGYNIYRYALNDPVNYNDPTGEAPDSVIDRRTQALLQTTKDCKGKSAQCAAFFAEAVSIPLLFYPGGVFMRGTAGLTRVAALGRAASSSFNRTFNLSNKLSGGLKRIRKRSGDNFHGEVAGGQKAATKLFNGLTRGKSKANNGGRVGSLKDGTGVQIGTRILEDGTKQTSVRITRRVQVTEGSRITRKETIKLRFNEKPE